MQIIPIYIYFNSVEYYNNTNIQFKFAILVNSIDVQRRHLRRQDSKYVKMAFKNLIKKLKKVAESGMLP